MAPQRCSSAIALVGDGARADVCNRHSERAPQCTAVAQIHLTPISTHPFCRSLALPSHRIPRRGYSTTTHSSSSAHRSSALHERRRAPAYGHRTFVSRKAVLHCTRHRTRHRIRPTHSCRVVLRHVKYRLVGDLTGEAGCQLGIWASGIGPMSVGAVPPRCAARMSTPECGIDRFEGWARRSWG